MTFDLFEGISRVRERAVVWTERLVAGPHWQHKVAMLALLLSLLITFPRIAFFWGDQQIVNLWPFIEWQSEHLLRPIDADPMSHESKRLFRLTLPVLMGLTQLPWWGLLIMQFVIGYVTVLAVGAIAERQLNDRVSAAFVAFAFCQLLAGKVAFLELGGMGDAFGVAFLVLAIYARQMLWTAVFTTAACFTDERAVIAILFVIAYHFGHRRIPAVVATLVAVMGYLSVRLYGFYVLNLTMPLGERAWELAFRNLSIVHLELAAALSGLWIPVILSVAFLMARREVILLSLVLFGVGLAIAAAMSVEDIDRSLVYLFPVVLALLGTPRLEVTQARTLTLVVALVCLATPVNSFVGVSGPVARYAEGNIAPVEWVRAWMVARKSKPKPP